MLIKAGRLFAVALVVSVLIQMYIAQIGHADRGVKIVFTSTRDDGLGEIYVMDADGGNPVRLTNDPAIDSHPSWSPDGKRIAFVSNRDHGYDRIYVMDSDGGNVTRLTEDSINRYPAWSPDGGTIAFNRNTQICVMDTDGQNLVQLTHIGYNRQAAWSPDGRRIAFVSTRDGESEIYVMDENGGNQERRTGNKADKSSPSWSPDGQWIAYASRHIEALSQIYLVRADDVPRKKRLTRKRPQKYNPAWSPDGKTIAYTSAVAFENTRIHLMTDKGIYLKQFREVGDGSDLHPDWLDPTAWSVSPAGNFVTIWGKIKEPTSGR